MKAQGITPCLAVILVGDDSASAIYVRNKKRACEYIGIESRSYELPKETTEQELEKLVRELNEDETVDGILVQLPLPEQIDEEKITGMISPKKMWTDSFRKALARFVLDRKDSGPVLLPECSS